MKKKDKNIIGISRLGIRHAHAAWQQPASLQASTPPQTPTEIRLTAIWQNALPGIPVHRESNFIAIGGDSLSLAQVITQLESTFSVKLTVDGVANNLTLKDMAEMIDGLTTPGKA